MGRWGGGGGVGGGRRRGGEEGGLEGVGVGGDCNCKLLEMIRRKC